MAGTVRVRYAPSPTGAPHLGNIRTALFNWLFARSQGGRFIVRVEDTDQARLEPGATQAILDALRWLDIDWDEGPEVGGDYGPYVQSQRLELYHAHARRLLDQGGAYHCYCAPQRLDDMRKEQAARKQPPGYDRRCRDLAPSQREKARAELAATDREPVVRFKMPPEGLSRIDDAIRGEVQFDLSLLDDFVLLKSDGYPTYHLANVVDDHLMEISHVMRAEEWLSSAPRHQEIYRALGYTMPVLAHLPIILGPDRAKLSKRHGATSILDYRDDGYLADAMVNFLALLGWSRDDHTDLISRPELARHFGLERVTASPAIFNVEKLDWFNGVYIRQLSTEALADALLPWLEAGLPREAPRPLDRDYLLQVAPLVHERLRKLSEAPELTSFFFVERPELDPRQVVQKGMDPAGTRHALSVAVERLEALRTWDAGALEALLRPLAEELGLKTGQLFGALRVAVTCRTAAPPLFETMVVLGRERSVARLHRAVEAVGAAPAAG